MKKASLIGIAMAVGISMTAVFQSKDDTDAGTPKGYLEGIHRFAISAADTERSVALYRDVLSFEDLYESGWEAGSPIADRLMGLIDCAGKSTGLRLGNIDIFEFLSPTPKPIDPNRKVVDHGANHIAFHVVDILALCERLEAKGMFFHGPPVSMGKGIDVVYGKDPDGNVIEFMELGDDHPLSRPWSINSS